MKKFAIITDSTADLNKTLREEYDIDYVLMNYVVDGTEYPASLDWEAHTVKEYYDLMRNGIRVTTTQVPQKSYEEKFRSYLNDGIDVIYLSCSSALSGSINIARMVAKELSAEYPQNKIFCVDSLISSLGQGYLAICASKLRAEGKVIDEVVKFLEDNRLKVNQCGTTDSLEYLRRAGRVTASKAFFGNLFGVKPLLISNEKGENFAIKKAKGLLNAKKEIANYLSTVVENPEEQCLYISHSDSYEDATTLRDEIMKVIPFKECYIGTIGPIVGASVGPKTIIAFCFGKEVNTTTEGE